MGKLLTIVCDRLSLVLVVASILFLTGCDRQPAPPPAAQTPQSTPPNGSGQKDLVPGKGAAPAPDTKSEMVLIQAGRFIMGDKEEADAPPHEAVVSAFYMDKNLVTQEQFQKVTGGNPSRWKGEKNPVEQVRWSDAVKFCNQRSEKEGLQPCYDLQTWKCNFDAT